MAAAATRTEAQLATAATAAVQHLKDVGRLSVDDSVDQHGKNAFASLTDVTKAVQKEMRGMGLKEAWWTKATNKRVRRCVAAVFEEDRFKDTYSRPQGAVRRVLVGMSLTVGPPPQQQQPPPASPASTSISTALQPYALGAASPIALVPTPTQAFVLLPPPPQPQSVHVTKGKKDRDWEPTAFVMPSLFPPSTTKRILHTGRPHPLHLTTPVRPVS